MSHTLFQGITHIIFDLDGLLVDTEPLWKEAEQIILTQYDRQWSKSIAKSQTGLRLDEVAAIMVDGYGLDVPANDLEMALLSQMITLTQTQLTIMPGASAMMDFVKRANVPTAVASSSAKHYIEAILEQCGWADAIQVIASAFEVPRGKPAPDVYQLALDRLGADSAHCIAFEDSLNGAKAAQAAGLRTVAVPGEGFDLHEFEGIADVVLPSLNDAFAPFQHEFIKD